MSTYHAMLSPVKGRGVPPVPFLDELVAWFRTAPDEIFLTNDEPGDVMVKLCALLGPWQNTQGLGHLILHRKCCMLELLRCLGGFESSWHWREGVDTANASSMAHIEGQETGIFQDSWDSLGLEHQHHTLKDLLARKGITGPQQFIDRMKVDHPFAFEYAARLLRISYRWDGPIVRCEIDSSLSRDAVAEAMNLLSA